MSMNEFQETKSITFEWTLRGLKGLFESSKGDAKSKVTKSARFGDDGRWQVLFYANSGTGNAADSTSGHVSLFLSCEPTPEEKENAYNGRWVREGLYRFTFELHKWHSAAGEAELQVSFRQISLSKKDLFNVKEAHNHSFSYKTANWGWAQFARRDAVYFSRASVRADDAFVITCIISTSPSPPSPLPSIPRMPVPKDLLDSVGFLLDDPVYSDVEFVLARHNSNIRHAKRIYASKKLLNRADYFRSMFSGGFAEASSDTFSFMGGHDPDASISDAASELTSLGGRGDDSDEEDQDQEDQESVSDTENLPHFDEEGVPTCGATDLPSISMQSPAEGDEVQDGDESGRNVRAKLSHPSSPRSSPPPRLRTKPSVSGGPPKMRVIVKDVAYTTYRAVLYYLYTDTIRFAPLSSSFLGSPPTPGPAQTPNESQSNLGLGANVKAGQAQGEGYLGLQANSGSRREWIRDWARSNPGKPAPCSAKAVYRLADKLDLSMLKERAFQHITNSLTVENVPYEVFSTFSATFETVRKVEVKFFLDHWTDIRSSDAMRNVWQQIRLGRHPGFEEVWPVIATNLEFNPQINAPASDKPSE